MRKTSLTLTMFTLAISVVGISIFSTGPAQAATDEGLILDQNISRQQSFRPAKTFSDDLFSDGGGFFHPFISLATIFSDNITNAPANEQDDYISVISPGLMLSYPAVKDIPGSSFASSTLTPGGLVSSRQAKDSFKRFQTSLLYHADLEYYSDYSEADMTHHRVEGLLQFNLKGGVSFDLAGEYKDSADDYNGTAEQAKYQTSLVDLLVPIRLTPKTRFSLGAASFKVDYEAAVDDNRDRQDDSFSTMFAFRFRPKTHLLAEYQYTDINYDLNVFEDSTTHKVMAGFRWDATAKSSGEILAGYYSREFASSLLDSADDLILKVVVEHNFTDKTALQLVANRMVTESSLAGTNSVLNNQTSLNYSQKITGNLTARLQLTYSQDEYDLPVTIGLLTDIRQDDLFRVSPGLDYAANDWLIFNLSYAMAERDSNFDNFDFTTSTVLIRVSGYL